MKYVSKIMLGFAGLGLWACAHPSNQPPTQLMSQAEVVVREVEQPAPMQVAPLDVRMAREKLDSAKKEMDHKNYTEARRFAEQAMVDAQVAQAKSRADVTKKSSEEAVKSIETLRDETNRKVTP